MIFIQRSIDRPLMIDGFCGIIICPSSSHVALSSVKDQRLLPGLLRTAEHYVASFFKTNAWKGDRAILTSS